MSEINQQTGEITGNENGDGQGGQNPGSDPNSTPGPDIPIEDVIAALIEDLADRVEALEDMLKAVPDGPWAWAALDPVEKYALWQRLYVWVEWLEDRYIRNISAQHTGSFAADWYRHPVVVELLTALMVAHISAYRKNESAPSFRLVEWHEQCLWPTLERINKYNFFRVDDERNDWNGPSYRPSRRDNARFAEFLETEVAVAALPC